MRLNKETYTKYEFGLTFIFFIYFLIIALKSNDFIATYFYIVIGFTAASIILIIVLLLMTKSEDIKTDERDDIIESKSYRNAYISTIALVNIFIILALIDSKILQPFIVLNLLFATLFISHIILNLTKIYYYKRGI